jgi:hypothetical protein
MVPEHDSVCVATSLPNPTDLDQRIPTGEVPAQRDGETGVGEANAMPGGASLLRYLERHDEFSVGVDEWWARRPGRGVEDAEQAHVSAVEVSLVSVHGGNWWDLRGCDL